MARSHQLRSLFVLVSSAAGIVFVLFLVKTDVVYNRTKETKTLSEFAGRYVRLFGEKNVIAPIHTGLKSEEPPNSTSSNSSNSSGSSHPSDSISTFNASKQAQELTYSKTASSTNSSRHEAKLSIEHVSSNDAGKPRDIRPQSVTRPSFVPVSDLSKPLLCHWFSPGRFGNHLFEYASVLGIARTTGRSFLFPNDGELLKILKYPPIQNRSEQAIARCKAAKNKGERFLCKFDVKLYEMEEGKDYRMNEYLQSWVYFNGMQEEIKQAVTFSDEIVHNATLIIQRLRKEHPNTTFVGVHNRRGDLVKKSSNANNGYMVAPPEYFQKAMTYFRARFPRVLFVVLGEDMEWSKKNIKAVNNDVVFLPPSSSPPTDMQVLSMTDHMIRTVGTFGWWAAFKMTGRPTVVYLKDFVKRGSGLSRNYSENGESYMLPGWIGM